MIIINESLVTKPKSVLHGGSVLPLKATTPVDDDFYPATDGILVLEGSNPTLRSGGLWLPQIGGATILNRTGISDGSSAEIDLSPLSQIETFEVGGFSLVSNYTGGFFRLALTFFDENGFNQSFVTSIPLQNGFFNFPTRTIRVKPGGAPSITYIFQNISGVMTYGCALWIRRIN